MRQEKVYQMECIHCGAIAKKTPGKDLQVCTCGSSEFRKLKAILSLAVTWGEKTEEKEENTDVQ